MNGAIGKDRSWRGRGRGDYLLHQHLQPDGDDRRRSAGEKSGRKGPVGQAVCQNQPGARLARGDRLPGESRSARAAGQLGFDLVGYGCTTCIGNSGPLPEPVVEAINEGNLVAAAVLSGNRNFEGPRQPEHAGQLPGLSATGGGVCPGRDSGH